ncbi:MAG: hypothetical protein WED33_11350 [Bacteroidia bacterium]
MKAFLSILSLTFIVIIYSCSSDQKTLVSSEKESIKLKSGILINHTYPQINKAGSEEIKEKLNNILKNYTDIQYQIANDSEDDSFNPTNDGKINSEFTILFESDSLLSIEFRKDFLLSDSLYYREFRAVLLNHKTGVIQSSPEAYLPDFKRSKLLPFIYGDLLVSESQIYLNEASYLDGRNTTLTWTIKQDSFIVYPGGEGEMFGRYRVSIPCDSLGIDCPK